MKLTVNIIQWPKHKRKYKENIKKAAEALGMAMKFGPTGVGTSLGLAGLQSLGAPEEIEETETEQRIFLALDF